EASTVERSESSSKRFVVARAVRPSVTVRIETVRPCSATFWWMALLAKRVSALATSSTWTSVSLAAVDFARRRTVSAMRRSSRSGRSSEANALALFDLVADFIGLKRPFQCARCENAPARPRGLCPWFAWAGPFTIGRPPKHPMTELADGVAGIPELRSDAAVAWILQHADFLSALNLPTNLGRKLKLVATVVDGPGAIRLHQDSIVCVGDEIVVVPCAREQADVGHANDGQPVPAFGTHGSGRAVQAHKMRGFAVG